MSPALAALVWLVGETPDESCRAALRESGVRAVDPGSVRGVTTPVRIESDLGGIMVVHRGKAKPPVMDCQLARALAEAARIFRESGVKTLVYSGAYDYRTRRGEPILSEHARGLAIDVHALGLASGPSLEVKRDYEKGVGLWPERSATRVELPDCIGTPKTDPGRRLRTLACRLRGSAIFRVVIGPDDDADHRDHIHFEAFPDALARAAALLGVRRPR